MFSREQVMEIIEQQAGLLSELEDQRQVALNKQQKGYALIVVAAVVWLGTVAFIGSTSEMGFLVAFIVVVGFTITFFILHAVFIGKHKKEYLLAYKGKVLTAVTKAIQPGMRYRPHEGISEDLFKSSGLISSRIDRYHAEDLFLGEVGETELYFSEVKAERKDTSRDSEGRTQTKWKTLFDGVFFMADFHKEFSTWATVTPDFAERTFGWFGKKLQKLGGNVIHLENLEFEKAFVVRGGDQVGVRYVLTPDMQERLLKLREVLGDTVMFAFKDSKVVMLFATYGNWFEPDFKKPSYEVRQIEEFIMEMQICCEVVETMNLNTRIWTK
ncbi:DUF3137 domain-containing protein [Rubritalea spongiae]|uniref:DUF3137 domain-containing protein n=1 Tax=Rubritalea spongiae TaxID=430797 RepID=A0ABW5E1X1_9BACT